MAIHTNDGRKPPSNIYLFYIRILVDSLAQSCRFSRDETRREAAAVG